MLSSMVIYRSISLIFTKYISFDKCRETRHCNYFKLLLLYLYAKNILSFLINYLQMKAIGL